MEEKKCTTKHMKFANMNSTIKKKQLPLNGDHRTCRQELSMKIMNKADEM